MSRAVKTALLGKTRTFARVPARLAAGSSHEHRKSAGTARPGARAERLEVLKGKRILRLDDLVAAAASSGTCSLPSA
jgi:hypothetical protein